MKGSPSWLVFMAEFRPPPLITLKKLTGTKDVEKMLVKGVKRNVVSLGELNWLSSGT